MPLLANPVCPARVGYSIGNESVLDFDSSLNEVLDFDSSLNENDRDSADAQIRASQKRTPVWLLR